MVTTALAAAVLYGAGAAVEQRQAAAAPESSAGRLRLLVLLARQPLWLLGIAAQIGGFAAHATALRSGPLATVQMLVSAELVVAVVIVRVWSGRPLSRSSWAAALTVVAAVAAFLALASPDHGHAAGHPHYALAAGLGAALTGAGALAAAAIGLRAAGRRRAVLLAVAAGLADSCSAVVTMAFSHVAGHGLAALATSWTIYALVVCGTGNVLLTQTAYQTGRPMITLPIIAAVTPVASVAIGIGLLGETPRTGAAGAAAAGFAVLVTSLALAWLARSVPHPLGQVAPGSCPSSQAACASSSAVILPAVSSVILDTGADTVSAATGTRRGPRTVTATEATPSSLSSLLTAQPASRTWRSSASSPDRDAMDRAVSLGSAASSANKADTSASGSSASSAFPDAVQLAASTEPVRDATRSARELSTASR